MKPIKTKIIIAVCAALTLVQPANAGAWLREKGTGFVSLSFGITQTDRTTNSVYAEYGLTDGTTIGIDISTFTATDDARTGNGHLFLRRSIGATDGPTRLAYEVGLGGIWDDDQTSPTVKTGLSWGRGFTLGNSRNGWVNLDAAYIYEPTNGQHETKIDSVFGLDFGEFTTGMVELSLGHQDGETYGAVEPSMLIRPRNSAFNIKMGAEIPFEDSGEAALKLGLWYKY